MLSLFSLSSVSVYSQWYQLCTIIVFLDHVRWVIDSMGLTIRNHFIALQRREQERDKKNLCKQEFIVHCSKFTLNWWCFFSSSYQRFKGSFRMWKRLKNTFFLLVVIMLLLSSSLVGRNRYYRSVTLKFMKFVDAYSETTWGGFCLILKMKRPICLQKDWIWKCTYNDFIASRE